MDARKAMCDEVILAMALFNYISVKVSKVNIIRKGRGTSVV